MCMCFCGCCVIKLSNPNTHLTHQVSKLLLKGESYAAGHGLSHIKLEEAWGYAGVGFGGVQYLDASCLLYDTKGECIGHVDYSNRQYHQGCVRHSGDVIDHDKSEGSHTLDIDLHRLPSRQHCHLLQRSEIRVSGAIQRESRRSVR